MFKIVRNKFSLEIKVILFENDKLFKKFDKGEIRILICSFDNNSDRQETEEKRNSQFEKSCKLTRAIKLG